jgi:hypothetical protein
VYLSLCSRTYLAVLLTALSTLGRSSPSQHEINDAMNDVEKSRSRETKPQSNASVPSNISRYMHNGTNSSKHRQTLYPSYSDMLETLDAILKGTIRVSKPHVNERASHSTSSQPRGRFNFRNCHLEICIPLKRLLLSAIRWTVK